MRIGAWEPDCMAISMGSLSGVVGGVILRHYGLPFKSNILTSSATALMVIGALTYCRSKNLHDRALALSQTDHRVWQDLKAQSVGKLVLFALTNEFPARRQKDSKRNGPRMGVVDENGKLEEVRREDPRFQEQCWFLIKHTERLAAGKEFENDAEAFKYLQELFLLVFSCVGNHSTAYERNGTVRSLSTLRPRLSEETELGTIFVRGGDEQLSIKVAKLLAALESGAFDSSALPGP